MTINDVESCCDILQEREQEEGYEKIMRKRMCC